MTGRLRSRGVTALTRLSLRIQAAVVACATACFAATPIAAQEEGRTVRTRVGIGPQAYPSYPGSDEFDIGPFVNVDRARGDELFEFEAPDESFGFSVVEVGKFSFGPAINFEGARTAEDVGADVPKVKFSLEPGAFVAFDLSDNFRLRGEIRKGVTGHKGWVALGGGDFVLRDRDNWLFSVGPRVTWSGNRYQDAWFGVTPETSLATGIPVFEPDAGVQAYGGAASFFRQVTPHWGVTGYAKYDRLVGDAADSPLTRLYGSRDQLSGGVALSYTWGGDR